MSFKKEQSCLRLLARKRNLYTTIILTAAAVVFLVQIKPILHRKDDRSSLKTKQRIRQPADADVADSDNNLGQYDDQQEDETPNDDRQNERETQNDLGQTSRPERINTILDKWNENDDRNLLIGNGNDFGLNAVKTDGVNRANDQNEVEGKEDDQLLLQPQRPIRPRRRHRGRNNVATSDGNTATTFADEANIDLTEKSVEVKGSLKVAHPTAPAPGSAHFPNDEAWLSEQAEPVFNSVQRALKHLVRAHRYTTDGKALAELGQGIAVLRRLMHYHFYQMQKDGKTFETDAKQEGKSSTPTLPTAVDVCPEVWREAPFGFPFFRDNFVITECTGAPPLSSIITIVINAATDTNPQYLQRIFQGIHRTYPTLPVVLGLSQSFANQTIYKKLKKFISTTKLSVKTKLIDVEDIIGDGNVWFQLLDRQFVSTKYVLVARRLTDFLPEASLQRLIRVLNYTGANAVGGSYRNESGHWQMGCYQTAMRNYVYKLVEGYDISYNSCAYCDYIGGPFVAKVEAVQRNLISYFYDNIVFVELFAKLRQLSRGAARFLVCPDVMFFTETLDINYSERQKWQRFAHKWEVNHIVLPNRKKIRFSCGESGSNCEWLRGIAMPKCCLEELTAMMQAIGRIFDELNINYVYEAGSVIGSIKFNGNLPYERDGDLYWDANDYDKVRSAVGKFTRLGYQFVEELDPLAMPNVTECLAENTTSIFCGYFALRSPNWRIQLYGVKRMPYERWQGEDYAIANYTRTLQDGMWIKNQPNPALYARNMYGDDIFEHVEHWITLGHADPGWQPYDTGRWLTCPRSNFHGCLDQFLPYGNLQFLETWL